MKGSVAKKLFWGMAGLILFYTGLNWLLNTQLLEAYYMKVKEERLIEDGRTIGGQYVSSPEDVMPLLEALESAGTSVRIVAPDGRMRYNSVNRLLSGSGIESPEAAKMETDYAQHVSDYFVRRQQLVDEITLLEWQRDPVVNKTFLALSTNLNNGDILRLRLRLSTVAESAALLNHFMMFTGVICLVVGFGWIYFFTRRFAKPIVGLRDAAQAMAQLDFSRKCRVETDDEIGELTVSLNDLSDRLEMTLRALQDKNAALLKAVERERDLDKVRKSFIADASHELKTPIALILGYAEGLRENVAEDEDSRRYYSDVIIDETRKMDKLVKELLVLVKMEAPDQVLQLETLSIDDWIQGLRPKMAALAKEQDVCLTVSSATGALVLIDADKFEQAVLNLVNNAISHASGEKCVMVSTEKDDGWIRLRVFNSGEAIPEEAQERIWDSFYRADEARVREAGRVGLGLSIVRAIQERHEAGFGMQNVDGGVCFWLDARLAEADEQGTSGAMGR